MNGDIRRHAEPAQLQSGGYPGFVLHLACRPRRPGGSRIISGRVIPYKQDRRNLVSRFPFSARKHGGTPRERRLTVYIQMSERFLPVQ